VKEGREGGRGGGREGRRGKKGWDGELKGDEGVILKALTYPQVHIHTQTSAI